MTIGRRREQVASTSWVGITIANMFLIELVIMLATISMCVAVVGDCGRVDD